MAEMELEFFLMCESISIDQRSNALSIFNVIEEVPWSDTHVVPRSVFISEWNFPPDMMGKDILIEHRLLDPNGKVRHSYDSAFKALAPRHRVMVTLANWKPDIKGDWVFKVESGPKKAHHRVTVVERAGQ